MLDSMHADFKDISDFVIAVKRMKRLKEWLCTTAITISVLILISKFDSESIDLKGQLTQNGAWCWFADPRAIYHEGKNKRTYIGYVNKKGDIMVNVIDHESNKVMKEVTLKPKLNKDDHANPSLIMLDVSFLLE